MSLINKNILLMVLMFMAAFASIALTPKPLPLSAREPVVLKNLVPTAFGEWHLVETQDRSIVNPELEKTLDLIYSDTLSRTYVNGKGDAIMLSLAFGNIQNRGLQVHKPEVCYSAQGFIIKGMAKGIIHIDAREISVMRLVAQKGNRIEPITYWIRSGDYIVSGWYEQNRARILAGLSGVIPDGILIRASTISDDTEKSYIIQEEFLANLIKAIPQKDQHMFLGSGEK